MANTGRRKSDKINIVDIETRKFVLDNDILEKVSKLLTDELQKGLTKGSSDKTCLKMFVTYVHDLPDGTEEGKFLALDLSGSNFRIVCVELFKNSTEIVMQSENFELTTDIIAGPGEQLFDYIAECLSSFIKMHGIDDPCLPLGFTFGFPCFQDGINSAKLIRWTKGFCCSGVVGKDVSLLLKQAIDRKGIANLRIVAIVNDTTGTLMSCAHKDKNCFIGLIIGTGTNSCYMESIDNIEKYRGDKPKSNQVIVNTEWGAFGDNNCLNFLRTKYDDIVDDNSINSRQQIFEKMISGMYLGELVRRIIADFTTYNLLFNGNLSSSLKIPYSLETDWLTLIADDVTNDRNLETEKILKLLEVKEISNDDCEVIKLICTRVVERAACLVSAGIAALLNRMKRPHTTIGIDGTLYHMHPAFKKIMKQKIKELTCPEYKFSLLLSHDGSGRGAALIAAVVSHNLE